MQFKLNKEEMTFHVMSLVLTGLLCIIVSINFILKLRAVIPYRVNCWFCNSNFWVRFPERNSWVCSACDQYNGFNKDGDYNKPLTITNKHTFKTPKPISRSPPRNGLCKMCNINQQLKVTQLANFVPMNPNNFDVEVEGYRKQLEKAYKLCGACKKYLKQKLHKEKEVLLGSKLIQNRTPEKKEKQNDIKHERLTKLIKNTSVTISLVILLVITIDMYQFAMKYDSIAKFIAQTKLIVKNLSEKVLKISREEIKSIYPSFEHYEAITRDLITEYNPFTVEMKKYMISSKIHEYSEVAQKGLSGFGCLIQIVTHLFSLKVGKSAMFIDLFWTIFILTLILDPVFLIIKTPVLLGIKALCISTLYILYSKIKVPKSNKVYTASPKVMKNSGISFNYEEDSSDVDTDDDVSLSKFGVFNNSDSSNETLIQGNNTKISGRAFSPRMNDSVWTKPSLNSTFNFNQSANDTRSFFSPRPNSVLSKPEFSFYQKSVTDDYDSDLDESISGLNLGSPKKRNGHNSVFSLKKFQAMPHFVTPTVAPVIHQRPLISPSKLGHGTSWVAGGYWGSESNRQIFNVNGSRSSSQSSGFESQSSSLNQRNLLSQPPSRADSVCSESGVSLFSDRLQSNLVFAQDNNHSKIPVHPQLKYDSHIHIPQAFRPMNPISYQFHRYQNSCPTPMDVQSNAFLKPKASRLIKLPTLES